MAIVNDNGNGRFMPVAPAYGGGGGLFGGGDGLWAIIFIIAMMNGGWGGMGGAMWPMMMGMGGAGGLGLGIDFPWVLNGQNNLAANMNSGFDHAATQSALGDLRTAVGAGFGDAQLALAGIGRQICETGGNVTAAITGAQNTLAQQLYANEIAALNRSFDAQTANSQGFNALQGQLAQCCCDNRLATCQTQNIIQAEAAATRAELLRIGQTVLDKMCQDTINEKNDKILELQNRLNMADFAASQARQDNYLQNALTAQTQYFLSLYPPTVAAPAA